jgi:hypothetical protein
MSGLGELVIVNARLALSPETTTSERAAYDRWIEHMCDMLEYMSVCGSRLTTNDLEMQRYLSQQALPEYAEAVERLRNMFPISYAQLECPTWQDFVLWCREHPRYDANGMPLDYLSGS